MAFAFHVMTYATITIIFLPHIMCLLAFLPLERLQRPAFADRLVKPATIGSG
jgi:hypothetical protein